MPVPNSVEFLGWTGKTVPGSMAHITAAIRNYQAQQTTDGLYIIFKECEDWKKKNVGVLFSSSSERKQENAVNLLLVEVTRDLNAAAPGLGDALEGYQHKKAVDGAQGRLFRSLGKGYSNERASYLKSGKQQAPVSGSRVHTVADGLNKDFKSLSVSEFERLGTDPVVLKRHMNDKNVVRMYFLNKIQRLKLLVSCNRQNPAGPRWEDMSGAVMHSKKAAFNHMGDEAACQMWAMDRYGNLFVDYGNQGYGEHVLGHANNSAKAAIAARGQTNHSSFCAGREIICAGNIAFWKGQLIHIDNGSGHYAPKKTHLYNAVSILMNEGAVLEYLRVGVMTANVGMAFFKGRTFMNNGAADWPQQDWSVNQDGVFNSCAGFQA